MQTIAISSLDEAKKKLMELSKQKVIQGANWSAYKVFVHCAKTIEYAMTGYPALKPAIVRKTIGRIVIKKFLRQGYMKHDLQADVPGSSSIDETGTAKQGLEVLIAAIDKFTAYNAPLKPHLIFGDMSKEEYDQYFAFHIADHLSEIR